MIENKRSVLFISSVDPSAGPASSALDYVEALRERGYEVDFLTKYPVIDHLEFLYVLKKESKFSNFRYKIWNRIIKPDKEGHYLFYRKESEPPVKISKVLRKITKEYNIIIVYFWQTLLSYRTIEAIYDKMQNKPTVVFLCADYSPMTGGCHFMGDCENYKTGCGNCPILKKHGKPKDFTYYNVKERIRINKKLKPIVFTNLYMKQFFRQSPVMGSGVKLVSNSIILDLVKFSASNKSKCRDTLGIPSGDKFVILAGCQSLTDKRKGMMYFVEAINLLWKILSPQQRNDMLILFIGHRSDELINLLPFEQKHLGFVSIDVLPIVYSAADVFVSPTINDAGPSMVNQSLACGTPVVCFEIGTALEVVKGTGAGFCVPLYDSEAMAEAIKQLYGQSDEERLKMRSTCREVAVQYNSYQSFVDRLEQNI